MPRRDTDDSLWVSYCSRLVALAWVQVVQSLQSNPGVEDSNTKSLQATLVINAQCDGSRDFRNSVSTLCLCH